MTNIYKYVIIIILFGFQNLIAQTQEAKPSLDKGSIKEQFDYINTKSSNYQNYKVVKRVWLRQLEKHIIDSLNEAKHNLVTANNKIESHQKTIDKLKTELKNIENDLAKVNESKNHMDLLGVPVEKSTFKTILWSVIALLFLGLIYFIYRFKNSNDVTKKTLHKYSDLEDEYNNYRTRALEREQVLNRKLQDEINKQKKS